MYHNNDNNNYSNLLKYTKRIAIIANIVLVYGYYYHLIIIFTPIFVQLFLDFRIRRLENKNVKRNDADGREERNKSCAHKATNNTKGF